MIVVADTSPINYLILISEISILERMYQQVVLPRAVYAELVRPAAPDRVRTWMEQPPAWIEVRTPSRLRTEHWTFSTRENATRFCLRRTSASPIDHRRLGGETRGPEARPQGRGNARYVARGSEARISRPSGRNQAASRGFIFYFARAVIADIERAGLEGT